METLAFGDHTKILRFRFSMRVEAADDERITRHSGQATVGSWVASGGRSEEEGAGHEFKKSSEFSWVTLGKKERTASAA
jgi:hypothetical protein